MLCTGDDNNPQNSQIPYSASALGNGLLRHDWVTPFFTGYHPSPFLRRISVHVMKSMERKKHKKKHSIRPGVTLQAKYKLSTKLGEGTYSRVYLAQVGITEWAVKVDEPSWISSEKGIYDVLHSHIHVPEGIAKPISNGLHRNEGYLILPRLGISLHALWVLSRRKFSHTTIAKLAVQILTRLRFVHAMGVVHGDVCMRNLVMGNGQEGNIVYLIDFGNSSRYTKLVAGRTFQPIHEDAPKPRDDLKELMRMLVKFHRGGSREWLMEVEEKKQGKVARALSMVGVGQRATPIRVPAVRHYWDCMKFIDDLKENELPDYDDLIGVFKGYLTQFGEADFNLRWDESGAAVIIT